MLSPSGGQPCGGPRGWWTRTQMRVPCEELATRRPWYGPRWTAGPHAWWSAHAWAFQSGATCQSSTTEAWPAWTPPSYRGTSLDWARDSKAQHSKAGPAQLRAGGGERAQSRTQGGIQPGAAPHATDTQTADQAATHVASRVVASERSRPCRTSRRFSVPKLNTGELALWDTVDRAASPTCWDHTTPHHTTPHHTAPHHTTPHHTTPHHTIPHHTTPHHTTPHHTTHHTGHHQA